MRFLVLGPMRVFAGQGEAILSAGRERTLLAMLPLHLGEAVSVVRLVDAIWGDRPPQDARNQVQVCVSRLRRRLAHAGMPSDLVVTEPAGYRMIVERDCVDMWEFRRLTTEARNAVADDKLDEARDRYRAGLALWRGPALSGIDSELVSQATATLDEQHVQAMEECAEIEIALGATGELVAELTDLARTYPYRERVHSALMVVLYRTGRYADALAAFRRLREVLRDELGVEPGSELQRLHRSMLNRDPELDPPREPSPGLSLRPVPVPRQLPAEATRFVGREPEAARVRRALVPAERDSRRSPAVTVLYGSGGVGKSALAVRVAHDLAGEFWAGSCTRICTARLPESGDSRLARYSAGSCTAWECRAARYRPARSRRQRCCVLLRPIGGCCWCSTTPLTATRSPCFCPAHQPAPSWSPAGSRCRRWMPMTGCVLTWLTGGREMGAEAARSIVAHCDGLPLAVRIAAGRLASRPDLSAHEYADALADRSRRLDELQVDDLAVRACIRTGYDALTVGGGRVGRTAARAFRSLGLLHVPDVAPGVVAAMLAAPNSETARAALDRLVDAQLLEPARSGRYRLHDLVRLVAAERAVEEDGRADRDAALGRAVAFYTASLRNAARRIRPNRVLPFGEPPPIDDVGPSSFEIPAQARAWVDDELPSLVPVLETTANRTDEGDRLTLWLSELLWMNLDARCDWQAASRVSRLVLEAATRIQDPMPRSLS